MSSSKKESERILNLLLLYEDHCDETRGDFHIKAVYLELKKDVAPQHHKASPVLKIYDETQKKELD